MCVELLLITMSCISYIPPLRLLWLRHVYPPTTGILKPYNLHALHRLGYRTDWSVDPTETVESIYLEVPPRRSVYRDIIELNVGTYTVRETTKESPPLQWSHEWGLIGRKALNPYIRDPNAWLRAAAVLEDQRLGFRGAVEFRDLNRVGCFKGPYAPTLA
jgi:hypothetical protein